MAFRSPPKPVPMPVSDADLISIHEIQYEDALKASKIAPPIIPYHFLNFFILVVYIILSPYETTLRLRFPVLGFVAWHSTSMLLSTRTRTAPPSASIPSGVSTGLQHS